jgi:DNA (cytosine-5)-methyltransferase 1
MRGIDQFAGPGGWDLAAALLGIDMLGIELDPDVLETRYAAGLATIGGSVAALKPERFRRRKAIMVSSPPCPPFSRASKGKGRSDLPQLIEIARELQPGAEIPELRWQDQRSPLVLEPLRWALALKPDAIACEQVPDVLPFWQTLAERLSEEGWHCWAGILSAEEYGVPQTRKRAILLAHRKHQPGQPEPTHAAFRKGQPPAPGLRPWVSMQQALGIEGDSLVGFARRSDAPAGEIEIDGKAYRERDFRRGDEPAPTLTGKTRSWTIRANKQSRAARRSIDQPAPTIKGGSDYLDRAWCADGEPVRPVSEAEASVLQGVPRAYPWRGRRSARFQQIGNAIPPRLALACLGELLG